VREHRRALVGGTARQALLTHVGHRPGGASNVHHLARLWHGRLRCRMFHGGAYALLVFRRDRHLNLPVVICHCPLSGYLAPVT
jgi:hypothetical protein